jgi:hypothetical protein
MACNSDQHNTPLLSEEEDSSLVTVRTQQWDSIEADFFRLYIQEKRYLKETMAAVEKSYGIKLWCVEYPDVK